MKRQKRCTYVGKKRFVSMQFAAAMECSPPDELNWKSPSKNTASDPIIKRTSSIRPANHPQSRFPFTASSFVQHDPLNHLLCFLHLAPRPKTTLATSFGTSGGAPPKRAQQHPSIRSPPRGSPNWGILAFHVGRWTGGGPAVFSR